MTPNPGDEWAAGDLPSEPEMTPQRADTLIVRDGYCYVCEADMSEGRGHRDYCPWPDIRAAWEADLKTSELERKVSNKRGRVAIERQARIDALERESIKGQFEMMDELNAGHMAMILKKENGEAVKATVFLTGRGTQAILDAVERIYDSQDAAALAQEKPHG